MLHNAKSHPSFDNENLLEKSVDEDSHSSNKKQIVIRQKDPIVECKSPLISIGKLENDHLTDINAETEQSGKCRDDKTVSNVNQEAQDNTKEEKACLCTKNTHAIIKKTSDSTEKPEKPKRPKEKKRAFSLLDVLISVSIVAPAAIGFWRGVWVWMDIHAEFFPSWVCFILGAALHIAFAFFKDQFHNVYMGKWTKLGPQKRLPYRALRWCYTYTFGVACIAHWRGGWIIIDDYLFFHIWITTAVTFLLLACLVVVRGVRNLIATPMIIFVDTPSYLFQFPTRYNVVRRNKLMDEGEKMLQSKLNWRTKKSRLATTLAKASMTK